MGESEQFKTVLAEFVKANQKLKELEKGLKVPKQQLATTKRDSLSFITETLGKHNRGSDSTVFLIEPQEGTGITSRCYAHLKLSTSRRALSPELIRRALDTVLVDFSSESKLESVAELEEGAKSRLKKKRRVEKSEGNSETQFETYCRVVNDAVIGRIRELQSSERRIGCISDSAPRSTTSLLPPDTPELIAAVAAYKQACISEKELKTSNASVKKELSERVEGASKQVEAHLSASGIEVYTLNVTSNGNRATYHIRKKEYTKKAPMNSDLIKATVGKAVANAAMGLSKEKYADPESTKDICRFVCDALLTAFEALPVEVKSKVTMDKGRNATATAPPPIE